MKIPRDYRPLLATGRWFASLERGFGDRLVRAARLVDLAPGERLFSRGDPPCGLYAVVEGGIRASGVADSGKEAVLAVVEPPAWFGEIAVFDDQPRTHDAVAEGATRLLHVPRAALAAILAADPLAWRDLALLVTAKLRLAFSLIEDMALLPVGPRLARRLALMADGYGQLEHRRRSIELGQEELARMLGTSRQTINQHLKELESRGLVALSYGEIEILDLPNLRRAGGLD